MPAGTTRASAPDTTTPARTRGGWTPTGTAAARRSGPPSPGSKAERTRERLLDAARIVARRHGYNDTTIDVIVAEAEVARGSFYSYFESKHDVLRALVSRLGAVIDRDVAFIDPAVDNPAAEVRRATRNYLSIAYEHGDLMDLVDQMATVDAQVARDRDATHRHYTALVADGIREWQRTGAADTGIDPAATATALVAMLIEVGRRGSDPDDAATAPLSETLAGIWIRSCGLTDDA